ncbi:MAG: hypothetical protein M1820_006017 [Bogoriella megaspora]|nr:MAG: hypothetical protein M1820_006017 [Bogoriella megaspora]
MTDSITLLDQNRGPTINTIGWTCIAISILFVVLRVYTRLFVTRNLGYDDGLIVIALVLLIATAWMATVAVAAGLGRHIVYLQIDQIEKIAYLAAVMEPIGIFSYTFPKLAVAILIIKLLAVQKRGKWFLYSIIVVLFATRIIISTLNFARCNPPKSIWNHAIHGKCWDINIAINVSIAGGAWAAFVDFSLAIFPCTVIWNLQMSRSRKICISALMGLGVIATAFAIVKTTKLSVQRHPDITWEFSNLLIWTCTVVDLMGRVEVTVVIVCACIPTLPKLFLVMFGKQERPTNRLNEHPRKTRRYNDGRAVGDSIDGIININRQNPMTSGDSVPVRDLKYSDSVIRSASVYGEWHIV